MSDRWLPVVAAILGVLGGVAGAAVGGYVANKGQEQRFEAERDSRRLDQRIDAYVGFLRAVENEKTEAGRYDDAIFITAAAEVELVARNAALQRAARRLKDEMSSYEQGNPGPYKQARREFIELANADIEAEG
jgi:CHASE1-domain containing sensor protein